MFNGVIHERKGSVNIGLSLVALLLNVILTELFRYIIKSITLAKQSSLSTDILMAACS